MRRSLRSPDCFAERCSDPPGRTGRLAMIATVQVVGLTRNEKPYFSKIALASELRRKAR